MTQEISNIINELKTRINLLSTMNTNLDSSTVDSIENIIDKYGVLDTSRFNEKDIDYICDELGLSETIRTEYNKLDKTIESYINDFNTMLKNQKEIRNKEIDLYQKYIDIFSSDKLDDIFGDFEELDGLLNDLCISTEDKWKILEFIDKLNIATKEYGIYAINLNSRLGIYNSIYLDNKELVDKVSKEISNINIDIDMIPNLASKLSSGNNYDEVYNIITVLVLNELYKQLRENIANKDKDKIEIVTDMIDNTLDYLNTIDDSIIKKCNDIVIEYEELLNEEINKGNDIKQYMNVSIEDLENTVSSHEKAIMLKELPIINSIKETINSLKEEKTNEEYADSIKLLNNLFDAYEEIKES